MDLTEPDPARVEAELKELDEQGFTILEGLLSVDDLAEIRKLLEPHLDADPHGRNDFEGQRTQRVYALVSRGRIFEDLVRHPRILALCDRVLQENYLLTASQAICIHPGETPQPLHTDDSFYPWPRPRPMISLSTIWAVDAFTEENGATQVIPGSHLWEDDKVWETFQAYPALAGRDASDVAPSDDASLRALLHTLEMAAGAAVVFSGMLVHRGGEGRGNTSRLAFSNQYCQPWARQQENYTLGIAAEKVMGMHERVRQLLGFSIHPPFMGHFGGLHPIRIVDPEAPKPR